jgi:hypothetical protein
VSVAGSLRVMRDINRRAGLNRSDQVTAIVAADFLHGGTSRHARIFDHRGAELHRLDRLDGEDLPTFRGRALSEAGSVAGAARLVLGGLGGLDVAPSGGLPASAVTLPDIPLHPSQREAVTLIGREKRVVLVCGRRWGKSTTLVAVASDYAIAGKSVGVFAPTYRFLKPLLDAVAAALGHLPGFSINRSLGEIRIAGGGGVDFWSIDVTGRAARGRKYHAALIDEAAHAVGDYLADTLEAAIRPALLDYDGKTVLLSTPNGLRGAFWLAATDSAKGYVTFHAPTSANPHLLPEAIADLRSTLRPEIASQELDAIFLDVSGASIFPLRLLLDENSEPHPDEGYIVNYVGVAIDSNSGKGGPDRDGVAAVIFAVTLPNVMKGSLAGARVVLCDWDIRSLAQGGIVPWLTHVRELAMAWFYRLRPLSGLPKAHIEPAGNAYSLIEAAQTMGFSPTEIPSEFVVLGKDNRALHAEPHFLADRVKIGRAALEERQSYRGVTANHLVLQLTGFKLFDKEASKREDDLLDAALYGVLVGLGDGLEQRWSRLARAA